MLDSNLPILIAEDSEDDAFILQHTLKKAGLPNPTHICVDGLDVIDYLQAQGPYADRAKYPFPRMLIVDLKMPRMSGLDLLAWIKKHPRCAIIPCVVFTSSREPSDIVTAYRLGANAFITKPGDLPGLERILRALHHFWNWAELPESPTKC